jgi:hypothetical protein
LGHKDDLAEVLVVVGTLLLRLQVPLDVLEHVESLLLEQFVKVKGALRVVDLLLQHSTQVLHIYVRVLHNLGRRLANEYYPLTRFVQQDVYDFQDKLRMHWKQDLGVTVLYYAILQPVIELVQPEVIFMLLLLLLVLDCRDGSGNAPNYEDVEVLEGF